MNQAKLKINDVMINVNSLTGVVRTQPENKTRAHILIGHRKHLVTVSEDTVLQPRSQHLVSVKWSNPSDVENQQ